MKAEDEIRAEIKRMEAARDSAIKRGDNECALICNAKFWALKWVLGES